MNDKKNLYHCVSIFVTTNSERVKFVRAVGKGTIEFERRGDERGAYLPGHTYELLLVEE